MCVFFLMFFFKYKFQYTLKNTNVFVPRIKQDHIQQRPTQPISMQPTNKKNRPIKESIIFFY